MSDKKPLLVNPTPTAPNAGYPPPDRYEVIYNLNVEPRYNYALPRVITTQPGYTTPVNNEPSDNFLILSIYLTVLCCIFGSWVALCCTIPAIVAAVNAQEAEIVGDVEKNRSSRAIALRLNVVGFIFGLPLTIGAWVYIYLVYLKTLNQENDPY